MMFACRGGGSSGSTSSENCWIATARIMVAVRSPRAKTARRCASPTSSPSAHTVASSLPSVLLTETSWRSLGGRKARNLTRSVLKWPSSKMNREIRSSATMGGPARLDPSQQECELWRERTCKSDPTMGWLWPHQGRISEHRAVSHANAKKPTRAVVPIKSDLTV